ncbi:unnamed protein product, partial [Caenorhabditis brenneri]
MARKLEKSKEEKEKDAERQRKNRAKKKNGTVEESDDSQMNSQKRVRDMTLEERREYERVQKQKKRSDRECEERVTKYSGFTPAKKREYKAAKQRLYRKEREETQSSVSLNGTCHSASVLSSQLSEVYSEEFDTQGHLDRKRKDSNMEGGLCLLSCSSDTEGNALTQRSKSSFHNPLPIGSQLSEVFSEEFDSQGHLGSRKNLFPENDVDAESMMDWSSDLTNDYRMLTDEFSSQKSTENPSAENQDGISMRTIAMETDTSVLPERKLDCKIRVGLIDVFQVETDCVVVPHYGPLKIDNKKELYNQLKTRMFEDDTNKDDYQRFLENECDMPKPLSVFSFDGLSKKETYRMSIHVEAPTALNNKYTIITEAKLRRAYLLSLHAADANGLQSITFPILGRNVHRNRSVALALQTFYAYTQAATETTLKLIYLVTNNVQLYDEIGNFLSYIREIDLSKWSREQYFMFEDMMFSKIKKEVIYSTIPGTDMVWRAFELNFTPRMIRVQKAEITELHKQSCGTTKIPFSPFQVYSKTAETSRQMPTTPITISTVPGVREMGPLPHIPTDYPMVNVCGSNEVLRKIWVISFYYMYYSGHIDGDFIFSAESLEYKTRHQLFNRLKYLHAEIVKEWKRVVKSVPFKCSCSMVKGYHEDLSIFMTRLSYPDVMFDNSTLFEKEMFFDVEGGVKPNDIHFLLAPFPQRPPSEKKVTLATFDGYREVAKRRVMEWREYSEDYCRLQTRQFQRILNYFNLDEDRFKTGIEDQTESFGNLQDYYDRMINSPSDQELVNDIANAYDLQNLAEGLQETAEAAAQVQRCIGILAEHRFQNIGAEENKLEIAFRSRLFRKVTFDVNDETLWLNEEGNTLTVDQFIAAKLEREGESEKPLPEDDDTVIDDFPVISSDFPELVNIGKRTDKCYHCGALAFPTERIKSCCKKGAVWIPPLKILAPEIKAIFQKCYKRCLIS